MQVARTSGLVKGLNVLWMFNGRVECVCMTFAMKYLNVG